MTDDDEALKKEVARRIRRLRVDKGWRQSELARRVALQLPNGIHRSMISKYENAQALPTLVNAAAVGRALSVPLSEIMPTAEDYTAPLDKGADLTVVDEETVLVRINERLPKAIGYRILAILEEFKAAEREKR